MNDNHLKLKAYQLRETILDMVYTAKSGHIGGSYSATEILLVLFSEFLRYDIKNLKSEHRDYFVLSKGHVTPIYYSLLADCGFFDAQLLSSFRQMGSILQGHPKIITPGVEVSTGSLGQGFGNAAGMALAIKNQKKKNVVVTLLGDGELQEGVVWETAMAIGHFKLTNLLTLIDFNSYQTDGCVQDIMNVEPIVDKFQAFGFTPIVVDGHDISSLRKAFQQFYDQYLTTTSPLVIIAKTVKGKGVSFMENTAAWHGKPPKEQEYFMAKEELKQQQKELAGKL